MATVYFANMIEEGFLLHSHRHFASLVVIKLTSMTGRKGLLGGGKHFCAPSPSSSSPSENGTLRIIIKTSKEADEGGGKNPFIPTRQRAYELMNGA